MQSGSWASWVAASPPEMFGEPDYDDMGDDECAAETTPCEWTCVACGELAPGCACDHAAMTEALRDAATDHTPPRHAAGEG